MRSRADRLGGKSRQKAAAGYGHSVQWSERKVEYVCCGEKFVFNVSNHCMSGWIYAIERLVRLEYIYRAGKRDVPFPVLDIGVIYRVSVTVPQHGLPNLLRCCVNHSRYSALAYSGFQRALANQQRASPRSAFVYYCLGAIVLRCSDLQPWPG